MFKWYYYHFLNFLLISELHKSSRDFHLQVSLRIPCVSSYGSTFKRVISNEDSILLWSMVNIASNWFVLQTEEKRFSKCLYWPPGGKLCPKFFDALIHLISFKEGTTWINPILGGGRGHYGPNDCEWPRCFRKVRATTTKIYEFNSVYVWMVPWKSFFSVVLKIFQKLK